MPEVQREGLPLQKPGRRLLLHLHLRKSHLQLRKSPKAQLKLRRGPLQPRSVPLHPGELLQRQVSHQEGPRPATLKPQVPGAAVPYRNAHHSLLIIFIHFSYNA